MFKVFYRLSDKGNIKNKLSYATKQNCLFNAIEEFGIENIVVIADNCSEVTIQWLKNLGISYEITSLGNSASFKYMCLSIFEKCGLDDIVYLLEDDYIHLSGSKQFILEGLEIGDYITLYDHPDYYSKYIDNNEINPLNIMNMQKSQIFICGSKHWRTAASTTMTFACKVSTLKRDFRIISKYLNYKNPRDFEMFIELTQNDMSVAYKLWKSIFYKKVGRYNNFKLAFIVIKNKLFRKKLRTLLVSIPANSTHSELNYLSPGFNWSITEK